MNVAFINAWGIILKGGAMMWPILLLSVVALSIAIEKFISLNKLQKEMNLLKGQLLQEIRANRLKDALKICDEQDKVLGRIIKAGILRFGQSRPQVTAAMQEAASLEIHLLKQRMDILGLIVNVAPVLGLLGTVSGMTVVFHAVQIRANALNPMTLGDMSSGIWQALLTTGAGLIVGVMSLAAYSFCAARINDIIFKIELSINAIADLLEN